jgi:hypothetical protein
MHRTTTGRHLPVADIPQRIKALTKYGRPIVYNEDDKHGEKAAGTAEARVNNGVSWGFMHEKMKQHFPFAFKGAADDLAVYATLKRLSKSPVRTTT